MGKKANFYTLQKELALERAAQRKNQGKAKSGTASHQDEQDVADDEPGSDEQKPNRCFKHKPHGHEENNLQVHEAVEPIVPAAQENDSATTRSSTRSKKSSDLRSIFKKLTTEDLEKSKLASMQPLEFGKSVCLTLDDLYPKTDILPIPQRPSFTFDDTKQESEDREQEYFRSWKRTLLENNTSRLSYFEQNLEVWRQLWRVIEMSDILLVIADVRNPLLHIPPSLFHYVVKVCQKTMLLVLNKIDLVSPETVHAWEKYLSSIYPGIEICTFSCNPQFDDNELKSTIKNNNIKLKSYKRFYRATGVLDILEKCKILSQSLDKNVPINWKAFLEKTKNDLSAREKKAADAINKAALGRSGSRQDKSSRSRRRKQLEAETDDELEEGEASEDENLDQLPSEDKVKDDKEYVTLGTIGQPNVGKSSILNAFFGSKHVSVSKSPGHTKHFQTLILAPHLRLCDCPGLVFPSLAQKELQIIGGVYSISQVQDCVSVVKYIAERFNLIAQLHLQHPLLIDAGEVVNEQGLTWTAWDICESFALKKGFKTAKRGRPDIHRAANLILRMVTDGKLHVTFQPVLD